VITLDYTPKIKDCKVKQRGGLLKTNFVPKALILRIFGEKMPK
jgi:hypothetical protein